MRQLAEFGDSNYSAILIAANKLILDAEPMILALFSLPIGIGLIALSFLFRSMRKATPSRYFGIRTRLTLNNDDAWNYVHNESFIPTLLLGIVILLLSALELVSVISYPRYSLSYMASFLGYICWIFIINRKAAKKYRYSSGPDSGSSITN